jgi:hypothetical protein
MHPRPILHVIGPSIAYVVLTQGQFSVIDVEDAARVGKFNWCALWFKNIKSFYAVGGPRGESGQRTYIHRFIANTPSDMQTDHFNRHTLDNRKANLRHVTNSENQKNKHRNYGKGYVERKHNKWTACYHLNLKRIRVRGFTSEEAARKFLGDLKETKNPSEEG